MQLGCIFIFKNRHLLDLAKTKGGQDQDITYECGKATATIKQIKLLMSQCYIL